MGRVAHAPRLVRSAHSGLASCHKSPNGLTHYPETRSGNTSDSSKYVLFAALASPFKRFYILSTWPVFWVHLRMPAPIVELPHVGPCAAVVGRDGDSESLHTA